MNKSDVIHELLEASKIAAKKEDQAEKDYKNAKTGISKNLHYEILQKAEGYRNGLLEAISIVVSMKEE